MSINLMSAIFRTEFRDLQDAEGNTTKASTAKFVCIALADHANDEGEGAYPSIAKLAYKTNLSRTAIINALDALKFNGILLAEGKSKWDTINYTVNSGCFSQDSLPSVLVNPLDSPSQPTIPPPVNPVDPIHPLTILKPSSDFSKTEKQGDLVDGMLFYGKQAQEQKADKVEEIIQEIERGLHVNITRTTANQAAAKRLLKDGRPFGQWLTWCISDEWRAAHLYIYADLDKIWQIYPQAFERKTDEQRGGYHIQDIGERNND